MPQNTTVLLTGVTGFLGSHTTIQLLNKGYQVLGTMRNLDRADAIRKVIAAHTKNSVSGSGPAGTPTTHRQLPEDYSSVVEPHSTASTKWGPEVGWLIMSGMFNF